MELLRAACMAEQQEQLPVPAYPLVARTAKKTNPPVYDALGPFPDETIMSGIDRVLFFMGARRAQQMLNLPSPSCDSCSSNSDCSISVTHVCCPEEHKSSRVCNTTISTEGSKNCPDSISVKSICCCPKCQSATSRSTIYTKKSSGRTAPSSKNSAISRVKICEPNSSKSCPQNSNPCKSGGGGMKKSFSLCSLACRKLKQMLTPSKNDKSKWVWTRMRQTPNGCDIYEIYDSLNAATPPSQIDKNKVPQVIFVVLTNGITMPFEILKNFKK